MNYQGDSKLEKGRKQVSLLCPVAFVMIFLQEKRRDDGLQPEHEVISNYFDAVSGNPSKTT